MRSYSSSSLALLRLPCNIHHQLGLNKENTKLAEVASVICNVLHRNTGGLLLELMLEQKCCQRVSLVPRPDDFLHADRYQNGGTQT